jgi:hypothetical protein
MSTASPATALARSLQDTLGSSDLAKPAVLAVVDGFMAELAAQCRARVLELEDEIARRDAADRYRQALAQAGVILHDRPELTPHLTLATDMILLGVPLTEVRIRMLEMGSRH